MTIAQKIVAILEAMFISVSVLFGIGSTQHLLTNARFDGFIEAFTVIISIAVLIMWVKLRFDQRVVGLDRVLGLDRIVWPDRVWDAVRRVSRDAVRRVSGENEHESVGWALAESEVDSGEQDSELWSKALVKAKGAEKLRKVEYMKMRVKQLKNEHRSSS